MQEKVIFVLGARQYSFEDSTGKRVEGVKVFYVDISEGKNDVDFRGYQPAEQTVEYHRFHEFEKGAGFYRVKLDFDLSGKKPKLVFNKFTFLDSFSFVDQIQKAKVS